MIKYSITKKSIIGKLLFGIPFAFFTSFTYLANVNELDEEGMLHLKPYMFLDVWFWLIVISSFFVVGLLAYLVMRKYKFYDNGEMFVVEKGLFWKREVKLSYKQVNTVSIKRSLLDLIFKTAKVEVDSGAALSVMPEFKLHLNLEYAYYLKTYLETKKLDNDIILEGPSEYNYIEEEEKDVIYQLKKGSLILMGVVSQGLLIGVFVFSLLFTSLFNAALVNGANNPEYDINSNEFQVILITFIMTLIIVLFMIIITFFKYYNYRLIKKDDSLEYEYGLISKSSFKFNKDKINAVYIKQSILYRLFKKYSLEVSVIGIGDEVGNNNSKTESKYLLPIASKDELEKILNIIDAKELLDVELNKPTKYSKLNLIYLPLIIPTIIFVSLLLLLLMIKFNYYVILTNIVVIYLFIVIYYVLKHKYHGYKLDDKLIVRTGAFTLRTGLMKKESIQLLSYNNGPIRRLLGVGSITFHYRSLLETVSVKGLELKDFNIINEKIFKKH